MQTADVLDLVPIMCQISFRALERILERYQSYKITLIFTKLV